MTPNKCAGLWRKLALTPVGHDDGLPRSLLFAMSMAYTVGKPDLEGRMRPNYEADRGFYVDHYRAEFAKLTGPDDRAAAELYASELCIPSPRVPA